MKVVQLSAVCLIGLGLAVAVPTGEAAATSGTATVLYVTTTGHDVGSCTSAKPCKTINYALTKAAPNATIHVAAGTYHQTVVINQPVTLTGAGVGKTILNGAGLDPGGVYYGVVYVHSAGRNVVVSGFTITNPFPYAYTGGEPEIVALSDPTPSDLIVFDHVLLSEGTADSNRSTDFPIGIDTFKNAARTVFENSTIEGTFQGGLFEDNGLAIFRHNTVKGLISNTANSTTYVGEGLFFLSDLKQALVYQDAFGNTFTGYAGYGVGVQAGYDNGNCPATPCDGSIQGKVMNNVFALKGAKAAAAIFVESSYAGNQLTFSIAGNTGYVTTPTAAIREVAKAGGAMSITAWDNPILVKS